MGLPKRAVEDLKPLCTHHAIEVTQDQIIMEWQDGGRKNNGQYLCIWKFGIGGNIHPEIIEEAKLEADDFIKTEREIGLVQPTPMGIHSQSTLRIAGIRKDQRCSWCSSFKTILKRKVEETGKTLLISGVCIPKLIDEKGPGVIKRY